MKVRDKTFSKTDYLGQEADACERECPCRPCFRIHDCGYTNSQGKWIKQIECVTRYNNGCPQPTPEPTHSYSVRGRLCRRCGTWKIKEQ